jgi:hypothetical protein
LRESIFSNLRESGRIADIDEKRIIQFSTNVVGGESMLLSEIGKFTVPERIVGS